MLATDFFSQRAASALAWRLPIPADRQPAIALVDRAGYFRTGTVPPWGWQAELFGTAVGALLAWI